MQSKFLGCSTEKIPVIGQGCMGIGGEFSKNTHQDQAQVRAIQIGLDLGMSLIDTAEIYGAGHSEEVVGKAVAGRRKNAFIATKFSPENSTFEGIIQAAEGSLRRLGTDYIDLYQTHWPNPAIPLEETMRAMERLIEQGKIRYIGMSNFSIQEMKEAQRCLSRGRIVSNQLEYNLFDRFIEMAILPYCEAEQISVIAYSPLNKGRLATDEKKMSVLSEIAGRYGKTIAQISLNWLIRQPAIVVIPKAVKEQHILENGAAVTFELDDEDFRAIDRIFAYNPVPVPTDCIKVTLEGEGSRKAYQTLEQAIRNPLGFTPSPSELAESIKQGEPVKPVRLVPSIDRSGVYDYELIEGRVRYWAWVIAHNGQVPIPALVRDR